MSLQDTLKEITNTELLEYVNASEKDLAIALTALRKIQEAESLMETYIIASDALTFLTANERHHWALRNEGC